MWKYVTLRDIIHKNIITSAAANSTEDPEMQSRDDGYVMTEFICKDNYAHGCWQDSHNKEAEVSVSWV